MPKAFLINAEKRTITEVQVGTYKDIYPHIGNGCSLFECIGLSDNGDTLYVDEEGMLKPCEHFIYYKGYRQPLAGNGLVLGTDGNGESADPKMTLAALKKKIIFMDRNDVGLWLSLQKGGR